MYDKEKVADVIELRILRWTIILDNLGGPVVITRILINKSQFDDRSRGDFEDGVLLALKMHEEGIRQGTQGIQL